MNKIMHPIEPEELMAYLDGELPANRASATAAHLGGCAECQGLAAEFRNVSQNLKTWKLEATESVIPPAIAAALAENRPEPRNVSPEQQRSWREFLGLRWETLAWMGTAAAVFLVVFGATDLFQVRNSKQVASQVNGYLDKASAPPQVPAPPASAGISGGSRELLHSTRSLSNNGQPMPAQLKSEPNQPPVANGPMIIRTAQVSVITKEFDKARANLEAILKRHRGYVGELKVGGTTGSGRTLTATLRVPADQLDAALTDIKTLGRVESESQSGQDVTSQYVDLQARLSNARNTEQRLTDLLRKRTGKLSDVLEVEQELDRVRGEIEQMEAERKTMSNQVSFATLNATITEDYQAQLQVVPPSTSTRLGNAAVEGYRSMVDGVLSLALFLLSNGPSLLLWGAVLFMPARMIWKKVRRGCAS